MRDNSTDNNNDKQRQEQPVETDSVYKNSRNLSNNDKYSSVLNKESINAPGGLAGALEVQASINSLEKDLDRS